MNVPATAVDPEPSTFTSGSCSSRQNHHHHQNRSSSSILVNHQYGGDFLALDGFIKYTRKGNGRREGLLKVYIHTMYITALNISTQNKDIVTYISVFHFIWSDCHPQTEQDLRKKGELPWSWESSRHRDAHRSCAAGRGHGPESRNYQSEWNQTLYSGWFWGPSWPVGRGRKGCTSAGREGWLTC